MMELVVAVDRGWGIGNNGELLCRVSDDLKNFRAVTTGKTVILGSKTLSTFPGGKPLKNRRNIIILQSGIDLRLGWLWQIHNDKAYIKAVC